MRHPLELKFESLDDFHNYIASDNDLLRDMLLPHRLGILGDKIKDQNEKDQCIYESHIFGFAFEKGEIKNRTTHADGSQYPNFDLFTDDLAYLKQRANDEKNPKYKAHYNHLLWKSPAKNGTYAKVAIDSYFTLLTSAPLSRGDKGENQAYSQYFKNLFALSQEINYRKDEVLALLVDNLSSDKLNEYQKSAMMKFVVQEGKKIDLAYNQRLFNYANQIINSTEPDFLTEYLHLQILICQKLKISPAPFHEKLAEHHLEDASKHKESFVVHDFYLKAILEYRKAGNKQKVEEVSAMLDKAKKNINLAKVDLGNNEKLNELYRSWMGIYETLTDELMEQPYEEIYTFLIVHDIFPKAEQLGTTISTVMMDLFSTMSFDINGNVSKKKKGLGLSPYHIHVQNTSWQIMWMTFLKGIKCGKISYETLIEYLQNHSWYYGNPEGSSEDGIVENFNWMELLLPSLKSFFLQVQADIKQKQTTNEGYILAVDSLSMKFEGLIREISRRIGAQVIEFHEDGTKERISFDKLLDNPKLQELIPADDIAFFKYMFTTQGINLRNNVAHCFYPSNKYGPAWMVMMITALLRLGNYEFTEKQ